jgi:hypothetical protein
MCSTAMDSLRHSFSLKRFNVALCDSAADLISDSLVFEYEWLLIGALPRAAESGDPRTTGAGGRNSPNWSSCRRRTHELAAAVREGLRTRGQAGSSNGLGR